MCAPGWKGATCNIGEPLTTWLSSFVNWPLNQFLKLFPFTPQQRTAAAYRTPARTEPRVSWQVTASPVSAKKAGRGSPAARVRQNFLFHFLTTSCLDSCLPPVSNSHLLLLKVLFPTIYSLDSSWKLKCATSVIIIVVSG